MAEESNKKPIAIIAVLLLLCAVVGGWLIFKSRSKTPNATPVAALRLDSIDETNRVVLLSDGGSHDPDGTLRSWHIAWGDGKEEDLSSMPQKASHTYDAEGAYTISLSCADNLGATSSLPAMTNIVFDFMKRQKAAELAQAEAKRQAEAQREAELKAEEARKQEQARLEQERQKQMELAAQQRAREQQALEEKRKAEAELARQKALEADIPAPTPLAAGLPIGTSFRKVVYTPAGCTIGQFQIQKEKVEGKDKDGKLLVILGTRCVNFPGIPIPLSDWQIDGKDVRLQAARIRAALTPGDHDVTATLTPKDGSPGAQLKADITVEPSGECVLTPRN